MARTRWNDAPRPLPDGRRRYLRQLSVVVLCMIVAAWVTAVVAVLAAGNQDDARAADAIVVLGAAQYEGRPSPVLRARLDHALELWQDGLAPRVVLTGGAGVGDTTSEAAVGERNLRSRGIPDSALVVETRGHSTSQSLHAVAALLEDRSPARVILVSDPFHMMRLAIIARRLGMRPLTSPTRTSPISRRPGERWGYVVWEAAKLPVAYLAP